MIPERYLLELKSIAETLKHLSNSLPSLWEILANANKSGALVKLSLSLLISMGPVTANGGLNTKVPIQKI